MKRDTEYCGVSLEKIRTASPVINPEVLAHYRTWLVERQTVYNKKELDKAPKPWTTYKPLLNYRFTNTKREFDRETRWVIENIAQNPELSLRDKIANCILFRTWNKSSTYERLGGPWANVHLLNKELYRQRVEDTPKDYLFYTSAFNCGGLKQSWMFQKPLMYLPTAKFSRALLTYENGFIETDLKTAYDRIKESPDEYSLVQINGKKVDPDDFKIEHSIPLRMFHLANQLTPDFINLVLNAKDQKEAVDYISSIHGIGVFLSYQMFVDMTYIAEFPFTEEHFTVSGPGCSRGLDHLFTNPDGLNKEEQLFYLTENQEELFDLPYDELYYFQPKDQRRLTVMAFENLNCEGSKLIKILNKGKGRVRYPGGSETKFLF